MRAPQLPLLLAAAALWLTAVSGRDVAPFRALQSEEGSIDGLIYRMLQFPEAQGSAEGAAPEPWPARPRSHPVRQFAYYHSDPEYSAPRQLTGHGPEVTEARPDLARGAVAAGKDDEPTKPALTPSAGRDQRAETALPADGGEVREKRPQRGSGADGPRAEALRGPEPSRDQTSDVYFIVTVVGASAAIIGVTVLGGFCYHYLERKRRLASEGDLPTYGVTGPHHDASPSSSGDRKLAQSAQMYHYQHKKQHMSAIEEGRELTQGSPSDEDSDEEQGSEHTVYECPGLAPSGEMEVKNPLFHGDSTPCPAPADAEDP